MALISSEGECRLLAVLFHSIHSVVSDPQGTHCTWSRRDSANSRSCVAVPTAPGLAVDELKVQQPRCLQGKGLCHCRHIHSMLGIEEHVLWGRADGIIQGLFTSPPTV